MSKFPRFAGVDLVKILVKKFGFQIMRQTGSHAVSCKFVGNEKIVTVVPLHKEVKTGTIFGILALAKIEKREFLSRL